MALDADRKNGPAARCFAADAHDCIMVRIKRPYRIQVCGTKMCPNGELASDPQETDRHRPDAEDMQKVPVAGHLRSACSGVKALRNTSDARRQSRQALLPFRSLDPFRALREPDPRRRDEKRPFPLRTKNCQHNPKQPLYRKSPIQVRIHLPPALQRRVLANLTRSIRSPDFFAERASGHDACQGTWYRPGPRFPLLSPRSIVTVWS